MVKGFWAAVLLAVVVTVVRGGSFADLLITFFVFWVLGSLLDKVLGSPKKDTAPGNKITPVAEDKERLLEELNAFAEETKARKALTPINTPLLLKSGEEAYLDSPSILKEARAVRKYSSGGGGVGFRVAKGVYVGGIGRRGTSESHSEWRDIETGKLTLTNKRLIFDGPREDRIIPLGKIVSVTSLLDSIEVTAEGRNKSMVFTVSNPYIWNFVLQILAKAEDPQNLSNINLTIQRDGPKGTDPLFAEGEEFEGEDPLFNEAVEVVTQYERAPASLLQRRLKIGYARAARLLDEMEAQGIVGPADGAKPREVLKR